MIITFLISLFITLFIIRVGAHLFHDKERYNTPNEKSKTITFYLRKKTGFDWHHIHIGIILLLLILPLIILNGLTISLTILLAISLSLIADQIILLLIDKKTDYFSKKSLLESIILHIIIAILFIVLSKTF